MTGVYKIKELIDQDIDKAFDWLDIAFQKKNDAYDQLCHEYIDRSRDFRISDFKSRLKRLVARYSDVFDDDFWVKVDKAAYHKNSEITNKVRDLLCELNFTHQQKYFYAALKSTLKLIPFVIRGTKNQGQKWLCNRLIYDIKKRKKINEVIYVDCKRSHIFNLHDLIEELARKLDPNSKILNHAERKILLRTALEGRMKDGPQFIVFENFYGLSSQAQDFELFQQTFKYLSKEFMFSENQCICFFIESATHKYHFEHLCLFTNDITTEEVSNNKELKFIDLNQLESIGSKDIAVWLDAMHPDDYERFSCLKKDREIYQKCSADNLDDLIKYICEKIDYKNHKEIAKWITL